MNRDPIGELGGLAINAFVFNHTLWRVDPLGLSDAGADAAYDSLVNLCRCFRDPTTTASCLNDARAIADAYVEVFDDVIEETRHTYLPGSDPPRAQFNFTHPEIHFMPGLMCFQWATRLFEGHRYTQEVGGSAEITYTGLKIRAGTPSVLKLFRVGKYRSAAPADGGTGIDHNYILVTTSLLDTAHSYRPNHRDTCNRILDPWKEGKPKVYRIGDNALYKWDAKFKEFGRGSAKFEVYKWRTEEPDGGGRVRALGWWDVPPIPDYQY
jgi:hypothetical protein